MSHALEPATTGRSKCRACKQAIVKGTLRIGERAPNPFGEGEAVYWFHPACAALKRPHVILELAEPPSGSEEAPAAQIEDAWLRWATRAATFERLVRVGAAGRAPSGRARCRECRQLIEKQAWRVRLDIWEEGRFAPLGFVHAGCLGAYCRLEAPGDLAERVLHGAQYAAEDVAAVREAVGSPPPAADESSD